MKSLLPVETIEQKILLTRDQKVILDSDLAMFYGGRDARDCAGCEKKYRAVPRRFRVSAYDRGVRAFEITIRDLKDRGPWWSPILSLRLYGAGRRHALQRAEK